MDMEGLYGNVTTHGMVIGGRLYGNGTTHGMVIGGLSVESVTMFAVSTVLFIFLVACIVCVYCSHRFGKVMKMPHCNEEDHHPISARFIDTEDNKTQSRSLTSSPLRKLEVIIEHQEEQK